MILVSILAAAVIALVTMRIVHEDSAGPLTYIASAVLVYVATLIMKVI